MTDPEFERKRRYLAMSGGLRRSLEGRKDLHMNHAIDLYASLCSLDIRTSSFNASIVDV